MKGFADRLREARVALGMTQEQLGFAIGVTKSSISAWENGRETPSFSTLPLLRKTLQRSLDELISDTSQGVGERSVRYAAKANELAARDPKEEALLLRFRKLPARKRAALLDLMLPS